MISALVLGLAPLLPLPLPNAPQQDSVFAPVAAVAERGIRRGIYPGAVVVIGRRDTVLYAKGFGHLTWSRNGAIPSASETRWDLASLTKVVATASAVLVLVDQGRVNLDAPAARYLPRFTGGGRERVTVRMLLDHTSGLRAYLPLYRLARTREAALALLYRQPLRHPPGAVAEYSDLNGILLGLLVEAVSGEPLDRFAAREVFAPLGMTATGFAPELPPDASVAPSRRVGCCAARPPRRVNDNNAFFLGGVAGHAGLFSTGLDLARFAQAWLRGGETPAGRWVSSAAMQRFLQREPGSGSRALGWDTAAGDRPSVFGASSCACSYGHTGWTGTLLWVDPERDLFLVFLTNRSLEPRVPNSIAVLRALRSELSERVLEIGRH